MERIDGYFDYYVYGIFDTDGQLGYVGKGVGNRMNTHCDGYSSNANLNHLFFLGERLYAEKLIDNLSESQALVEEARYILALQPVCNVKKPRISKYTYEKSVSDEHLRPYVRQEEKFVEGWSNPLVTVKRSPNYACMKGLVFPCEVPLMWCGNHYRVCCSDLVKMGCELDYDTHPTDTLSIPLHCF